MVEDEMEPVWIDDIALVPTEVAPAVEDETRLVWLTDVSLGTGRRCSTGRRR